MRPGSRRASRPTATGDLCPLNPDHGHMYVSRDERSQRCNNVAHDPWRDQPATRASWPHLPLRDFLAAVEAEVTA